MRVLHLLSLAGLVRLLTSSPTPPDTAVTTKSSPIGNEESDFKHLIARFEDPSVDVVAVPEKHKLEGPGEVKICNWLQCFVISAKHKSFTFPVNISFRWNKLCGGAEWTLKLNTRPGPLENPCRRGEDFCRLLTSVICKDHWSEEEDGAPFEHHPQSGSSKTRHVDQPGTPNNELITRAENTNLDGLGETVICENTWGNGRCDTLSANNVCITIPEGLAHHVRSVYQAQGSICKYFDRSCPVSSPTATLNSLRHPVGMEVSQLLGSKIGFVMCKDQWAAGKDVGLLTPTWILNSNGKSAGGTTISKTSSDKSISASAVSITSRKVVARDPGDVTICKKGKWDSLLTCWEFNNLGKCAKLPFGLDMRDHTLSQQPGVICSYYSSHKVGSTGECEELLFTLYSPKEVVWKKDIPRDMSEKISSYWCRLPQSLDDGDRQGSDDPVEHNLTIVKNAMYSGSRSSHLFVCNSKDFKGLCLGVSQSNSCTRAAIEIGSLTIERGTQCIFFSKPDCLTNSGPPRYEGSNLGERRLADVDYPIQSFKCRQAPARRSITSEKLYATPIVPFDAQFSPLTICHDVGMKGQCFVYVGPGCLSNPFNIDAIESYIMEAGYECAFYPYWNCDGTTRGPPHYDSSGNGPKRVDDTQWDIWSISCYPAPFDVKSNGTNSHMTDAQFMDAPGDTITCKGVDLRFCRMNANALNRCVAFNPRDGKPASVEQSRGAICKYYTGSRCDGDSISLDSRPGRISIRDLGSNKNRLMAIECHPGPF